MVIWFTSIYGCRTFVPIFLKCESTFAPLITNPFVPRILPYLYFHRRFIEPFCASTFCMYMYYRVSTFQELILHFKIRWSLTFDQLTCGVVLQKCIFDKGANGHFFFAQMGRATIYTTSAFHGKSCRYDSCHVLHTTLYEIPIV